MGQHKHTNWIHETASRRASFRSDGCRLGDQLIVTPVWVSSGYIQFALGSIQFSANRDRDASKSVYCNVGGFDWREGPQCYVSVPRGGPIYNPNAVSIAQTDCFFVSSLSPLLWDPETDESEPGWHGGDPSDGSSL